MSWCDRRLFVAGGALALAGCGFRPLHGEDGPARSLRGKILLPEATDPVSYAFRERARRRLGDGAGATWRLDSELTMRESGLAVTRGGDITRYSLSGRALFRLVNLADGRVTLSDELSAETRFDATAGVYAVRRARADAERRLATELAERVSQRILAEGERLSESGS